MKLARLANSLWQAAALPNARRFRHATRDLHTTQAELLRGLLRRTSGTQFGRAHHFDRLHTIAAFQETVPLHTYEDLAPWIEQISRGDERVLTPDPVTHFVPTSGSTSARKLIPWTAGLKRDFNRAINPWICDLFSQDPNLKNGPAYWSISPAAPEEQLPGSPVRLGLEDDTDYLGGLAGKVISKVMAVPAAVRHVWDTETFRYLVLLHLLAAPDLRFISVWHPTFLTLLLDSLPQHFEAILHTLRTGRLAPPNPFPDHLLHEFQHHLRADPPRARHLESIGPNRPDLIWPQLALLSAWGDHESPERSDLTSRFPKTRFQPKGLLATEAVVTIPFKDHTPLAATSHFFEFLDEGGTVHLAHELNSRQRYEVVVTTSGGLYRYRLHDQVEVVDFLDDTPCLRFAGRAGDISDLRGEKLAPHFVREVLDTLLKPFTNSIRFRLLAADSDQTPPHYALLLLSEAVLDLATLASDLEARLLENPHYRLCRFLGQLEAARVGLVHPSSIDSYFAWRVARSRSKKLGDLKPVLLDSGPGLFESIRLVAASGLQDSPSSIDTVPPSGPSSTPGSLP